MKKLLIIMLALFTMGACATTGTNHPIIDNEQMQDLVIEVAARRIGYHVGRNNPKIIEQGIAFCTAFEAPGVDLGPLLAEGLKYLDQEELSEDPLIAADLETILKALNIAVIEPNVPLTDRQKFLIRLGAKQFKAGFLAAKANPKQRSVSCSQQINT